MVQPFPLQFSIPMRGSFSEVGGMDSPMTMRNTVMDSRVVMPRVTFSPESLGM